MVIALRLMACCRIRLLRCIALKVVLVRFYGRRRSIQIQEWCCLLDSSGLWILADLGVMDGFLFIARASRV